jgi:hypothetical protein
MFVKVVFGNPLSTFFFVIDGVVTVIIFFHYWGELFFGLFDELFFFLLFGNSFLDTLVIFRDLKTIFVVLNNRFSILIGIIGRIVVRVGGFFSI